VRTTVNLADDVAAAVDKIRRERSLGISEVVNELVRAGLASEEKPHRRFRQKSRDLGEGIDFDNVGEALETLDGPHSS
jgi:metal-responsive CopG/Arc/MetJ family transcriptional regulator